MKIYAYRYVATELATDIVVNVGDVKFYLHKVLNLFDLKQDPIFWSVACYFLNINMD